MGHLVRCAWLEAHSCVFAAGVLTGLAVARRVPLPLAGQDSLLQWCVGLTLGLWALGAVTWRARC